MPRAINFWYVFLSCVSTLTHHLIKSLLNSATRWGEILVDILFTLPRRLSAICIWIFKPFCKRQLNIFFGEWLFMYHLSHKSIWQTTIQTLQLKTSVRPVILKYNFMLESPWVELSAWFLHLLLINPIWFSMKFCKSVMHKQTNKLFINYISTLKQCTFQIIEND